MHTITIRNSSKIRIKLESLEVMEKIIDELRESASNKAIRQLGSHNGLIGAHREDFRTRTEEIITSRKKSSQKTTL